VQKRVDEAGFLDGAADRGVRSPGTSATHALGLVEAPRLSAAKRALTLRREWLWIVGLCALFAVLSARRALGRPYPFYDDVAYLDLGNGIRDLGGPARLVTELFAARFTEDLRNPLYPAVLSVIASRDAGYHRRAQVLAVALGIAALLCCWYAARRLLGPRAALATLGLLSINSTLIEQSARESVETMLLALWALSIAAVLGRDRRPRRWLWAGALCGLAFLCKGTGLFLLFSVALALVIERGVRVVADRVLWSYLLGFVIVASPLLVRNMRMHGWPTHNSTARVRLLWTEPMPDYAEIFAPNVEARLPSGLLDYWRNTSAAKLGARLGRGALETAVAFGESLSINPPRLYGPWHAALIALGLALTMLAIALTWSSPRGFPRTLLLVQAVGFFVFFVLWNAQGVVSRYFLPVAAGLATVLGSAAERCVRKLERWEAGWPWLAAALVTIAAALSVAFDRSTNRLRPGFLETQRWLVQHLRPGEAYAVDSRSHLQPRWLLARGTRELLVSASWQGRPLPAEELIAWLRKHDIRYVVLDANSHVDRLAALRQCEVPYFILDRRCREKVRALHPGDRRYLFYDRVPIDRTGGLILTDLPPGLRVVHVTPKRHWAILEIEPER